MDFNTHEPGIYVNETVCTSLHNKVFFFNNLILSHQITPKIHHNLSDTTLHIQWKIDIF